MSSDLDITQYFFHQWETAYVLYNIYALTQEEISFEQKLDGHDAGYLIHIFSLHI